MIWNKKSKSGKTATDPKPSAKTGGSASAPSGARAETFLASILVSTHDAIIEIDDKQSIVRFNPGAERIFGYTQDEVLGQSVGILIPERLRARHKEMVQSFAAEGLPYRQMNERAEVTGQRKNGEEFAAEGSIARFDCEGKTFLAVILRDITIRKLREAALLESEARYRTIIENMADIVYQVDLDGTISMVSPAVEEILGYTPFEMVGTQLAGYYKNSLNRDVLLAALEKNNGHLRNFQAALRHRDGTTVWFLTNAQYFYNADGELAGIEGTARDITEYLATQTALRESEARFRTLLDNMPNPVALKDGSGRYELVNKAFGDVYGRGGDDVIGTRPSDNFPEIDWSAMERADAEITAGEKDYFETEIAFEKNGDLRHHQIVKFPVVDSQGRRLNVGTIVSDITERKRAEEMLRQSQKMEVVGQLTGGVAHDFNNLLAVTLANLDLAFDVVEDDSPALPFLRRISQVSERGAALTQRLLAFSRQQSLQPQLTDLAELIGGMAELMNRTLGEKVEIKLQMETGLWHCRIDRVQLENAVLNLAVNARDAMPDGGSLSIRAENLRAGRRLVRNLGLQRGPYVAIRVCDTGAGMTKDVLERAFDPFFTTKEIGKGSGLGLSMVYGFAQQSGGKVEIDSTPGQGTEISIYLPAHMGGGEIESVGAPTAMPVDRITGTGEHILIVEDDEAVRAVTTTILNALGYRVTEAGSVEEAQPLLANGLPFDLLLTDVVLPGGADGYELAQQVAKEAPEMKIVLMSGFANDRLQSQVESDPHMAFLRKPYRKLELASLIREQLAGEGRSH